MSSYLPIDHEFHPSGTTVPLVFDVEEDMEKEIQHFVKLSRMRDYAKAHELFDHTLKHHVQFFPVVVEYCDMVLEQGWYRRLSEFLEERILTMIGILDREEVILLRLLKALSDIYCKGALRLALNEAKAAFRFLEQSDEGQNENMVPNDTKAGYLHAKFHFIADCQKDTHI
ncbi:hypothetical protein BBP40_008855 [Aspergillus hancockii]|nr:hypothetical protein BBP40_008855 [Aspergillus hancockii]